MSSKTILLVEDNPDDVELTKHAFEEFKLVNSMVVARDGVEAIRLLHGEDGTGKGKLPILPQLVLLDLKLPKLDGLEVLRLIRSTVSTKRLPVVILTSSREESDLIRGYALGANSYVCKPINMQDFSEAAKQLNLYWLVLNEPPPAGNSL